MAGENEQTLESTLTGPGDDAPPTPVEVTLPEEGAEGAIAEVPAEGAEAPAEETPEPQKPTRLPAGVKGFDADGNPIYEKRAKQRIHELNTAWRNEKARAEDAERRLADSEREKADLAARSRVVDKAAMDTHEQRWKTEEDSAKRELAAAHEKQDYPAVAEATAKLSSASSELQAIRAYKANLPAEPQRQQQQPQQRQNGHVEQQPQVQLTEPMRAWIEDNPYLVAGTDDFDPDMSAHAQTAAMLLDGRYRRAGRSAEIGASDGYFTELTSMIQQEFPEYWEGQPAPQPSPRPQQRRAIPMTRQNGAGVAPASRATTPAPGQPGSRVVSLSGEEKDMALRMAHNGVYKYPAGHAQAGRRMSDTDAIVHHARYVQADRSEQAKK